MKLNDCFYFIFTFYPGIQVWKKEIGEQEVEFIKHW